MINWLQQHLLPCVFKTLVGFDCPMCGFQRALLFLLQGRFADSFKLFPPLMPCLLFFVLIGIYYADKKAVKLLFLKVSCYGMLSIIMGNYIIKIASFLLM